MVLEFSLPTKHWLTVPKLSPPHLCSCHCGLHWPGFPEPLLSRVSSSSEADRRKITIHGCLCHVWSPVSIPGAGFVRMGRQLASSSLPPTGPTLCVLCCVAQSCPTLWDPMHCSLPGSSVHGDSPGKNAAVDCHSLLQGIFPNQGLNPVSLIEGRFFNSLSYQGSPRILEWVAYPFSRGTSLSRNWTGVSCIAGKFFTSGTAWEPHAGPGVSQV